MGEQRISTVKLWDAEAIAQNENILSPAIDMKQIDFNHLFSLHAIIAGAGQVDIAVQYCSEKDGTYIEDSTLIANNQAAASIFSSFTPALAPFMKIKVTENNTGAITGVTLWLNVG